MVASKCDNSDFVRIPPSFEYHQVSFSANMNIQYHCYSFLMRFMNLFVMINAAICMRGCLFKRTIGERESGKSPIRNTIFLNLSERKHWTTSTSEQRKNQQNLKTTIVFCKTILFYWIIRIVFFFQGWVILVL